MNENVSIINCYFSNNTASLGNYNGGAICVNREVTISNSYFIDNNVATGSNYSGNAIYMHNGGMRVINNSFCNMKPESDYIHVSSGNITIINNLFMIINDTASSGDHHDGIISYFILYVNIRLIDNNFNESTAAEYCGLTNTHTSTIATTNNSNTTTPSSAINKIVATSEPTLEFTLTWGTNSSMKGEKITSTINVLFPTPVSATMKNVTSTIQEAITNTIMFVNTTTCTVDKNSVTATTTQTPVHTTRAIVTTILPPTSTQSITSPQTSTRPTTVTEEVTEDDGGVDDPTVPFYAYIIISVVLCMLCCSTGCCCYCCYYCFFMRKSRKDPNVEVLRVSSLSIMGDQYTTHPQVSSRL